MNTYFLACFLLLLTHAASEADFQVMTSCPPYIEFTSSAVVVKFVGCPSGLLTSHLELLASKFKDTYNSRNKGLSSNTNTCDPVFREVISVAAFLAVDFEVDFDRRLSDSEHENDAGVDGDDDAGVDGDNKVDGDNDAGVDGDDKDGDGRNGDAESDFECPGKFEVRFDVTARCRGCDLNTVTLFDEEQEVNHYEDDKDDRRVALRKLQLRHDKRQLLNECICPINPEYRAVTEEEMVDAYDSALDQLSDLPPFSIEKVKDVVEIERVECDTVKNNFGTFIDLSFATDSMDGMVADEILTKLSDNFLQSYNDLAERFCDPLFRKIENVQVVNITVTPVSRRELLPSNFTLPSNSTFNLNFTSKFNPIVSNFTTNFLFNFRFFLVGICRGCPSDSLLFDDAARRRLTIDDAMPSLTPHRKGRRLQQGSQCFCAAVNRIDGAPTAREFGERYNSDVRGLAIQDMLGGSNYVVTSLGEDESNNVATQPPRGTQCNINADCIAANQGANCVNNQCLHDGNPRITLTWEGDDDLDLIVMTPDGTTIWYQNDFDSVSRGTFDTGYVQDVSGQHVESVYFPQGPVGEYRIIVSSFEKRGEADKWTIEVFEGDVSVLNLQGDGSSEESDDEGIVYFYQ